MNSLSVLQKWLGGILLLAGSCSISAALAQSIPDTIARVKPAVVGIGTFQKTRRPPARLRGTGFAVHDGRYILTNSHVVPTDLDDAHLEYLAVMTTGADPDFRQAEVVAKDEKHDIALLRITGTPLPALELARSAHVREGEIYLFTGFPIGAVLGLYPATHRAMIASITPVVIPADKANQLDPAVIRRLREPYDVFQLDGTAYPGNSGSPLYDPESGRVVGIINKVFVKETKENILKNPSGISYAIPAEYASSLLKRYINN